MVTLGVRRVKAAFLSVSHLALLQPESIGSVMERYHLKMSYFRAAVITIDLDGWCPRRNPSPPARLLTRPFLPLMGVFSSRSQSYFISFKANYKPPQAQHGDTPRQGQPDWYTQERGIIVRPSTERHRYDLTGSPHNHNEN